MSTPAIHDCHDLDEIVDGNEHSSFVDLSLTEDLVSGDRSSSSTPFLEASSYLNDGAGTEPPLRSLDSDALSPPLGLDPETKESQPVDKGRSLTAKRKTPADASSPKRHPSASFRRPQKKLRIQSSADKENQSPSKSSSKNASAGGASAPRGSPPEPLSPKKATAQAQPTPQLTAELCIPSENDSQPSESAAQDPQITPGDLGLFTPPSSPIPNQEEESLSPADSPAAEHESNPSSGATASAELVWKKYTPEWLFQLKGFLAQNDCRYWKCTAVKKSLECNSVSVHVLSLHGHLAEVHDVHNLSSWFMHCCGRGSFSSMESVHEHAKACPNIHRRIRDGLMERDDTELYKQADTRLVKMMMRHGNGPLARALFDDWRTRQ